MAKVKATVTSKPHITVCRHHEDELVHIGIEGYEIVRCGKDVIARRTADIYVCDDGFVSGSITTYDRDNRPVRCQHLDEEKARQIASDYDCYYYASVA